VDRETWEQLCDGCGKCCELERSGFACPALDCTTNRCSDYANRLDREMCLRVHPGNVLDLHKRGILPETCGYVRYLQSKAPLLMIEQARLVPFCVSGLNFQGKYNAARKEWYRLKALPDAKAQPGEYRRLKKKANIDACLTECLNRSANACEKLRVTKR